VHPLRNSVAFLLPGLFVPAVLLLAAFMAGCSAESDPAPPPGPPVGPGTPDLLVQDFQTVYETMSAVDHARLLDTAFVMPLQSRAVADYPDLGPAIELAEALRIHERLFLRQEVTDPNQQPVRAVQAIAFQTFAKQGAWTQAAPGSTYPGTVQALYDVVMLLDRGGLYSTMKVQGTLRFHVAQRDTVVNGVAGTYCRLRAITDLTMDDGAVAGAAGSTGTDKASETVSLGRLLGLWR
jgi:hypothetical protein